MKNRLLAISMVTMACTLCACGTQRAGTSAFTEGSTEQAVMTEERTEQTASDTTEQAEATGQTEEAVQTRKPSYQELDHILDEINTDIYPGTAGSSLVSVKAAAHLLNWGVGTSMTTDEIRQETTDWLSGKSDTEQSEFTEKFASVYDAYQKLLEPDAEELLEDAGCEDAAYPWSDAPVETIEAIYEVIR